MPDKDGTTTVVLLRCLDRLKAGDPSARRELLAHSWGRILLLAGKMFRQYRGLPRWIDAEGVAADVYLRLERALRDVTLNDVQHFFRLTSIQIRRELIDRWRHYYGPSGPGARHTTPPPEAAGRPWPPDGAPDASDEPGRLLDWGEIHEQIGRLPGPEREVFELHWYQGLPQVEIAELLGVSPKTVGRRWLSACEQLLAALGNELPFAEL